MTSLQKSGGVQPVQGGPPQVPPNGMVVYGSGLVFGGNVYPVLVDGVPMQAPVGAHQAAVHQRMQMQMQQVPPQAPQIRGHKPIAPRPACQQSVARAGWRCPAPSYMTKPNQQNFGHVTTQQQQYNSIANMQQLQGQILQRQLIQASMGSPYGHYGNYNLQPNAGGDSGGWNGYAMMQPADANKPYSFGWSHTD
ncbi:uncharacterized protein LOC108033502 [Drosophila biarmipes]|uniref:uncharacterized protein LOC108033502 n=1 Tax=Drosophila biarmipes TaxID=125945 RepID=UPI0007E75E70|nr:uncharacterized protein LOC108033502 [Drosophila biarmipes]